MKLLPTKKKARGLSDPRAKAGVAAAGLAGAGAFAYTLVSARRKRAAGDGEAVSSYHETAVHKPPPPDAPGPSVSPSGHPESETERAERIDAALASAGDPLDDPGAGGDIVDREEAAAALEAASIGGPHMHGHGDPAMDPVYEAGGGESEGFEEAERDLIENATHGGGGARPESDAFDPEVESDRSGVEYGEGDEESNPDR